MNLTDSGDRHTLLTRRREDSLLEEMRQTKTPGAVGREYLDEVRAELWARHQAAAGGLEIVKDYTEAVDELIQALYRYADTSQGPAAFPRLNQRVAIIARGGYGRSELNPYSDIDLVFLPRIQARTVYQKSSPKVILHALWATRA